MVIGYDGEKSRAVTYHPLTGLCTYRVFRQTREVFHYTEWATEGGLEVRPTDEHRRTTADRSRRRDDGISFITSGIPAGSAPGSREPNAHLQTTDYRLRRAFLYI